MNENSTSRVLPKALPTDDQTDWPRVAALSDTDIKTSVLDDPDTFLPDANWMRQACVTLPENKQIVTLRLDPDILAWFRAAGRGYQTRINAVLRAFVDAQEHRQR